MRHPAKLTAHISILLLITISGGVTAGDLSPFLSQRLKRAQPTEQITAVVRFKKKANLKGLKSRREAFRALRAQVSSGRQKLQSLSRQKTFSSLSVEKTFWLTSGTLVKGTPEAIAALAQDPDVESVHENMLLSLPATQSAPVSPQAGIEWGISRIKADTVWNALGFRGQGVRVGHLDTGVDPSHPDLAGKIAGWAEFDAAGSKVSNSIPHDSNTHGTHTAGTIVGGNAGGSSIGVAPDAKLLCAEVITGNSGTFAQVVAGMEWVIDPDGNPDTDDGAHVVNMSLGSTGAEPAFIEPVQNMVSAGVFPAFSIGNSGVGTTSSPGNVPSAYGVGAMDSNDQVASFSSGGTVIWNSAPFVGNFLKPDVSAPGVGIKSSVPGGSYSYLQGTSMAAPHLSGTVALMLSANPTLTVQEIKDILKTTSRDLGAAGQDNRYGWGVIDAYAAVSGVNTVGTVKGTVTSGSQGLAATISVPALNLTVTANAQGAYQLSLSSGPHTLVVSAFGHQSQSRSVTLVLGATRTENFTLVPLPHGTLSGTVRNAVDQSGLPAVIEMMDTGLEPGQASAQGDYSLNLPEGTYRLRFSRLGYATQTQANVTVTAGQTTALNISLAPLPPLLVVDDDQGATWGNVDSYYTQALDGLGRAYAVWSVATQGGPKLEDLTPYSEVLWFTGNTWSQTLTAQDQTALKNYLKQGGRLLLSGQDIGYELAGNAFMKDDLGANFVQDDTNVLELEGRGVFTGMDISISGSDGANNQNFPSELSAAAPAQGVVFYKKTASQSFAPTQQGGAGPIKFQTAPTQALTSAVATVAMEKPAYRSLYCSFGVEAIRPLSARQEFLSRALGWLAEPIPPRPSQANASFRSPAAHAKLSGNAVSLLATANSHTRTVKFQYRLSGASSWNTLTVDDKPSFGFSWDTSLLSVGDYEIRIVPSDEDGLSNENITPLPVTVSDPASADIVENRSNGLLEKNAKVAAGQSQEVVLADGTGAAIPAGILSEGTTLLLAQISEHSISHNLPSAQTSYRSLGVFRKFEFANGQTQFPAEVTVSLPYSDENSDGIVDGTNHRVEDLRIAFLDETRNEWVELPTTRAALSNDSESLSEPFLNAKVNHFTLFGILAVTQAADLSQAIVYPNPFRPADGTIKFDNLSSGAHVTITTIAGRIVQELDAPLGGLKQWDVRNTDDDGVASGVYLYWITDPSGNKAHGKVAVIR